MALGVSTSQPPLTLLKTADSFSQKYFAPILSDAIFLPSPAWWRITRRGRKLMGSAIVVPVAYLEETSGGAYWGAQVLDTTLSDSVQPAQWEWKQYYQSIVIPYTDVLLNSGPTGVVDLIKAKEEITMASLLQKLSRALFKVAPQNTSIDLDSLTDAISVNTNVYAGIDRSVAANAFWKPVVDTTATMAMAMLQTMYGNLTFGNEEPDSILMTQANFNRFWNLMVGNIRYPDPDEETTRAGFRRHLVFNNAVVLHDQFVPANYAFWLNSKYVHACFHEDDYFVVDPFVKPSNQRILVSGVYVTLNVKAFNPRMCGAHTSITA